MRFSVFMNGMRSSFRFSVSSSSSVLVAASSRSGLMRTVYVTKQRRHTGDHVDQGAKRHESWVSRGSVRKKPDNGTINVSDTSLEELFTVE